MQIELTAENPWRPGDWRWQRALLLAQGHLRRIARFDDKDVTQAVPLARMVLASQSAGDSGQLCLRAPDFFWAYKIYSSPDPPQRAELEARILSNQAPSELCGRTGLTEKGLALYESLFYDVRSRLDCKSFVLHHLLGQNFHRGMSERDYATLWKYYGYVFGPVMLDSVIEQVMNPSRPKARSELQFTWQDENWESVVRKASLAARLVPVNNFTAVDIMGVYSKFAEIQQQRGLAQTGNATSFVANVQAILQSLQLSIGAFDSRVDAHQILRYDASASELPTPKLLQAAKGELPPDMDDPEPLTYPEPTNHARLEQGSPAPDHAGGGPDG